VCGYCTYGLFLALMLVLKCLKMARNLGVGHVQFHLGANGLRILFTVAYPIHKLAHGASDISWGILYCRSKERALRE